MKNCYNGRTTIKYKKCAHKVSIKIKNVNGLVNIDKHKKITRCWQDDTIHAYKSSYLHCGPSTKVDHVCQIRDLWMKIRRVIKENENKFKKCY